MKAFKGFDKNFQCRGFQFEVGKWFEHEGELVECQSGFHFCEQPSGVWYYYNGPRTRVWEIEAEEVLEKSPEPGADFKRVARRIKFVREITPGCKEGELQDARNTGEYNTGEYNTGEYNTGNRNTGGGNTGDRNTGYGNATNYSSGFFCITEPKVICFDVQTELTRDEFMSQHPEYYTLSSLLLESDAIEFEHFANLPGITPEKLAALHAKHLSMRGAK